MNKHYNPINRLAVCKGFTLIELMIVVAIIGILAVIVYPSYRGQLLRTHRAEGLTVLMNASTRQERFFSNNSTYTANVTDLGIPAGGLVDSGRFTISISDAPCGDITRCYTLTATPEGPQTDDIACPVLSLNSAGQKTPDGCW